MQLENLNKLKNILKFYRDCYQTDLKGVRIRNFISIQCEKRFIPDNNEFFHENYAGIPINTKWAKEIEQILFLNSKEKALFAGSVFIKGIQNTLGRSLSAIVPLYIHELDLTLINEVYFITVKETFFNPDFVELANSSDQGLNLTYDILSTKAPSNPFGFENYVLLQNFIKSHLKSWNNKDFANFQNPNFNFNKYFKEFSKTKAETLKIHSCLMFGVFKKPKGSLGVLNELNHLSKEPFNSKLLNQLFEIEEFEIQNLKRRDIFLPTTLSEKQESAFYASDAYPITQIIGPPGTGKSYTISALAIDAISNNKSVLIVTRNVQACRVITNIIENQFGLKGTIIKAYNQVYKRSLISKLSKAIKIDFTEIQSPNKLEKKISKIIEQIEQIENDILYIGNSEYKWGDYYSQNQENFFAKFKDKWFQYKKRTSKPIWELNKKLKVLRKEKTRLVKKYIKTKIDYDLNKLVRTRKEEFLKLNHALKENNLTLIDKKINRVNFDLVLKALPLWTSTTKEISKCLPLTNELFDIVIFDEASQCDLSTAIPSIFRAKQMIVVGDPHQLRHISFLSKKKQIELQNHNSVSSSVPDYRKDSLIDWTNSFLSNPDQTVYLDEHFRSKTDIIQFSNNKFYNNQLRLIRSNPISDSSSSIEIIYVDGLRNPQGVNNIEITNAINRVKTIVEKNKDTNVALTPSIGISSPYTEQVKQIKKDLAQSIPFDLIKRHNILVGTPFHFQGEERDIMIISFCIDKDSHYASLNYLSRKDVFNVLITRARNKQIVFTSIKPSILPAKSLLKEYLELSSSISKSHNQDIIYDIFFKEVYQYLQESGLEIIKQSTIVSGVMIDLVVLYKNECYCIDLIGYPGIFEEQFNLEDLRILNRINIPIFFLPYSSWYLDGNKTKRNLIRFIKKENNNMQ